MGGRRGPEGNPYRGALGLKGGAVGRWALGDISRMTSCWGLLDALSTCAAGHGGPGQRKNLGAITAAGRRAQRAPPRQRPPPAEKGPAQRKCLGAIGLAPAPDGPRAAAEKFLLTSPNAQRPTRPGGPGGLCPPPNGHPPLQGHQGAATALARRRWGAWQLPGPGGDRCDPGPRLGIALLSLLRSRPSA